MPDTPNHGYNVPNQGDQNWHVPLNENFEQYEIDIELRDADANKTNYTPHNGAKFLATDTGVVYTGNGTSWVPSLVVPAYDAGAGEATLHVDGARALRLRGESGGDAGRVVLGHSSNAVASGVTGATIGGGGFDDGTNARPNEVTGNYGTVGGGMANNAGSQATVGGGTRNVAADRTTIAGGVGNQTSAQDATVGGGNLNVAGGATSTVGGGTSNAASATESTIGGGNGNSITGGGGTVGGGSSNSVTGSNGTIAGGSGNSVTAANASVTGGTNNAVSGTAGMCPGGEDNEVTSPYGFAGGRQAKSQHAGAFVWKDSTSSGSFQSLNADEFAVQAAGGVYFFSNSGATTGVELPPGSGSWSSTSTRKVKSNVEPVDGPDVLDRVQELDVSTWSYDGEDDDVRHMGPMAEGFFDAFGLGDDPERISSVDADGVALAAIQGLADRLDETTDRMAEQSARIDEQSARIDEQSARIDEQSDRIDELEAENDRLQERLVELADHVDALVASQTEPQPADD